MEGLGVPVADPYKIDPNALKVITKQVEEERLITLKDDQGERMIHSLRQDVFGLGVETHQGC